MHSMLRGSGGCARKPLLTQSEAAQSEEAVVRIRILRTCRHEMSASRSTNATLNLPQHAISSEALNILSGSTDAKGRKLTVVKVPLPTPLHCSKEEAAGVQVSSVCLLWCS